MHAISERLRLPCPTYQLQDSTYDFSHVLDFCSQVEHLKVLPMAGDFTTKEEFLLNLITPMGTSNILPSTLNYELTPFTSVKCMTLLGIVPQNITKCDPVRAQVENLEVRFTRAQNIQQILCPEMIHDATIAAESMNTYVWNNVKTANFGSNDIWTVDGAIKLIPNVQELNLSENRLSMANLSSLHNLRILNISRNLVETLKDWHTLLGNVEVINLSSNKIKSLEGLNRLISLRRLDLSFNEIADINQSEFIANLPVLENISLIGNPLILEVDYRAKVLARFGERCAEIVLDNEKCTTNEIDKAMIFAALRKTKLR
jgi:nischarin